MCLFELQRNQSRTKQFDHPRKGEKGKRPPLRSLHIATPYRSGGRVEHRPTGWNYSRRQIVRARQPGYEIPGVAALYAVKEVK